MDQIDVRKYACIIRMCTIFALVRSKICNLINRACARACIKLLYFKQVVYKNKADIKCTQHNSLPCDNC